MPTEAGNRKVTDNYRQLIDHVTTDANYNPANPLISKAAPAAHHTAVNAALDAVDSSSAAQVYSGVAHGHCSAAHGYSNVAHDWFGGAHRYSRGAHGYSRVAHGYSGVADACFRLVVVIITRARGYFQGANRCSIVATWIYPSPHLLSGSAPQSKDG